MDAETWSLYYGPILVLCCHAYNLHIESDSAIPVRLMLHSETSMHPLGSLLACCKALMDKLNVVSFKHIYRKCYMVADSVAKNNLNHDFGIMNFDSPPTHAVGAFIDELGEVSRAGRSRSGLFGPID